MNFVFGITAANFHNEPVGRFPLVAAETEEAALGDEIAALGEGVGDVIVVAAAVVVLILLPNILFLMISLVKSS
ncbi:hypothetical protein D3C80_2147300 [compost metagenome]